MRRAAALLAALLLAACTARAPVWDGRRGYGGTGDYGYDLEASREEARGYRAQAALAYPPPGPIDDPWGPYIRDAAARAGVPEAWIREVMRQESGGRSLATSPVGAMGLMQVMPQTWDRLRPRLGLWPDPYEPRDNILAGATYLRDMHDRFGAPAFLAAYNAGPERVAAVLAGATVLPDETLRYVAAIAPRLGYGGATAALFAVPDDPSFRAYDGGGLVTPEAPTGVLFRR